MNRLKNKLDPAKDNIVTSKTDRQKEITQNTAQK